MESRSGIGSYWPEDLYITIQDVFSINNYNTFISHSLLTLHSLLNNMKFTLFQFIGLALVSSAAATPVENNELAVRDTILEPNSDSSIIKDRAASGSANYLIYPKTNASKRDIDAFTKSLQSQAGKAKVDTLTDMNGQLLAWYATLSANQVAAINKNSVVSTEFVTESFH
jgi:hypothetical protein